MGTAKSETTPLLTPTGARLFRIENLLRHSRVVDFAEFRARLGVSAATVKRDLQCMREELGAPIVWDRVERGYRLSTPWQGVAACLYQVAGRTLEQDRAGDVLN